MGLGPPGYVHDIDPDPDDPRAGSLLSRWRGDPAPVGAVGVPFDGAVPGRKGAREGPTAVREALRYNTTYHAGLDVDLDGADPLVVADLGDLEVPTDGGDRDPEAVHADLVEALEGVLDDVDVLCLLGGDHSLTHPAASTWADGQSLGVVYVDAHLDVRRHPPLSSGNAFRRLVDDGVVDGANLVNVGARPFLNSRHHLDWARKAGATVVPTTELREEGLDATVERAVETAADGADALWFSLDIDGLDQAHCPGCSAPSPGGLSPDEAFALARALGAHPRTVGMDVCEVAPRLDPTGNTARVAATAWLSFLAGLRMRG